MLQLTVEWLAGTYHGAEWPPSPLRVFQALLASARRYPSGEHNFDVILQDLERTPPPVIVAPLPRAFAAVRAAVPNNDTDREYEHLARGDVLGARKLRDKLKAIRERSGRLVDQPVHYQWECNPSPAWEALADRVTCVGQGVDLAWARLNPTTPTGYLFEPRGESGDRLQVPYSGVLDVLETRYSKFRQAIGRTSVVGVGEPRHATQIYRSPVSLPRIRSAVFRLRTLDDRPMAASRDRGLAIAAMVRHAIHEAAKRAGLEHDRSAAIMGHGDGKQRINAIPAPNAGHAWADGRIRRVFITASDAIPESDWNAIVRRLRGAELTPPHAAPWALLADASADDRVADAFMHSSCRWTSVTPVVLPGFDHRRGKPRPQRTARRLLRHAGIPQAAVQRVVLEPTGRLPGTGHATDYPVPRHLDQYPRTHLTIEFHDRVRGPLFLGAGVGVGLGLLAPCER